MLDLVHERFVPVWINTRETAIPDLRALDDVVWNIPLDENRRVQKGFNFKFFLRSVVLSPDGSVVLNPQAKEAKLSDLNDPGHFPYGQVKPEHYLPMLRGALALHESREVVR